MSIEKLKELMKVSTAGRWILPNANRVKVGDETMSWGNTKADYRLICAAVNLLPAFLEFMEQAKRRMNQGEGSVSAQVELELLEQALEKELG